MKQTAPMIAAALAAVGLTSPADAGTASGSMTVSATVVPTCHSLASDLSFGEMPARNPQGSAQSLLSLTCTPGTAFAVSIDNGRNGNRTMTARGGGGTLAYEIYKDAAALQRWGSGAAAVSAIAPSDGRLVLNAYGRIIAQSAVADTYADVVTITVEF
jgi:spore coat protein U-like protein